MEELFLRLYALLGDGLSRMSQLNTTQYRHFKIICEDADHKSNSARRRCARGPGPKRHCAYYMQVNPAYLVETLT